MGDTPVAGAKPPRASEIIERISTEPDNSILFKKKKVGYQNQ
jgi:hypothetical protein